MNIFNNIILNTDSYKYSQYNQYPKNTETVYSYIESRGGIFPETVYVGIQMFLLEYLQKPITQDNINEAEFYVAAHGLPFYREGWEYILNEHNGILPLLIKSAPEGSVIPTGNVLLTIENTDPKCFWLTSFLETALLRAIWYPTTVSTGSYQAKKVILSSLERTGDPNTIDFKLHDFGARGVSSVESSAIGGLAHLINFKGTDNVPALIAAKNYYNESMAGFSIPAMEHSTVTSWGVKGEFESFKNMLNLYAKPGAILACVSDSYDIYDACHRWGKEMKQQVVESGATLVIRPDSGNPVEVVSKCLGILDEHYGSKVNDKGYKVLNNVKLIQGDGITLESITNILCEMEKNQFSADNIAFGQGGALLQQVNRDTLKFAMKCSAIQVNGEWKEVFKNPSTATWKTSKKGRLALIEENGQYKTIPERPWQHNILKPVYNNGIVEHNLTNLRMIRSRVVI